MKKVLLTLISVLFVTSNAHATSFVLNPDGVLGTSYGKTTSVATTLSIDVDTTSTDMGTAGGDFTDVGHVTGLINGAVPIDYAGMNSGWYLVGGWSNLTGSSIDGTSGYVYNPGATLTLYASLTPFSGLDFYGGTPGIGDDSGFLDAFYAENDPLLDDPTLAANGAVEVAVLTLVSATTGGDAGPGVSINMEWEFTYLNGDFWLAEDGVTSLTVADLSTLHLYTDTNTMGFETSYIYDAQGNIIGGQIDASHHGKSVLGVVPEPATMALFGTGLFGLLGAGIRRKRA